MRVWLLNPYGPLPDEGWRKYRNILLGESLAASGKEITWFASSFSHHFKKFRTGSGYTTNIDNFTVEYIKTSAYTKNIGIARIVFEISYCLNAYLKLKKLEPPDVIIATDPSQFVGMLGRRLSKEKGAYLVLDLMDEWPELFERAAPRKFVFLVSLLVRFLKKLRKKNYKSAHGIIALSANYLQLAKSLAPEGAQSALIYNGVDCKEMTKWAANTDVNHLVPQKHADEIWCIYAGSLGLHGDNYDLKAIASAASYFLKKNDRIKFFIAGAGAGKDWILRVKEEESLDNLIFLGSLGPEELAAIYARCDIGLAVYGAGSNVDMPDKFYDYTASGLAVISSLTGEVGKFIETEKFGLTYKSNDHQDFIDKITYLSDRKQDLMKFKSRSKKFGREFDQKKQYKQINSLMERIKNSR